MSAASMSVSIGLRGDTLDEWPAHVGIGFAVERADA
jgi:hypothetical protein